MRFPSIWRLLDSLIVDFSYKLCCCGSTAAAFRKQSEFYRIEVSDIGF
ncbi:MAG: hypothetical protein ACI4KR_05595 [Ruminiclostridium sp.]